MGACCKIRLLHEAPKCPKSLDFRVRRKLQGPDNCPDFVRALSGHCLEHLSRKKSTSRMHSFKAGVLPPSTIPGRPVPTLRI
jgi:hypothetical protein